VDIASGARHAEERVHYGCEQSAVGEARAYYDDVQRECNTDVSLDVSCGVHANDVGGEFEYQRAYLVVFHE
jgi:hypothetical protein